MAEVRKIIKMEGALETDYDRYVLTTISDQMKKKLHEMADQMVDRFMAETNFKTLFEAKADQMMNNVITIQIKAEVKDNEASA